MNQRHFGLNSMKKPFKNYEWLENFKVVFGPVIFASHAVFSPKLICNLSRNFSVHTSENNMRWSGGKFFEKISFHMILLEEFCICKRRIANSNVCLPDREKKVAII